jgi:hypothetical protein
MKATAMADTAFDIESIIFNQMIMQVVKELWENQALLACNVKRFQEDYVITVIKALVANIEWEKLFENIKRELQSKFADTKCLNSRYLMFMQNNKVEFYSWLNYNTTKYTIGKRIRSIHDRHLSFLFLVRKELEQIKS